MIEVRACFDTQRLHLRHATTRDARAIFAYASDSAVTQYMTWPTHTTLRDTQTYIEASARGRREGIEYNWHITCRPEHTVIGSVGCRLQGHAIEPGYVVAQSQWGRGYATESATAVFDWARTHANIYRVWATCHAANTASANVLEKIGMTLEGTLRKWALLPNMPQAAPCDSFVFA